MTWKSFKDDPPETMIMALVCNDRGWMCYIKAIYCPEDEVWRYDNPDHRETLILDVTHYLEIPEY